MTFPADIKNCMKDCILSLLWPREEILRFLTNAGCTRADLKQVADFKTENLNRRRIVDVAFDALSARSDGGLGQFRAMLKALIEWSHFDTYYFDALKKLDRGKAQGHVDHLRQLQEIRDSKIKQQAAHAAEQVAKARSTATTRAEIQERFLSLFGTSLSAAKRGYALEEVMCELCRLSDLEATEGFRVNGEQIDGAVKYEGEHYLIEAKWQDRAASNEPVYQFVGKIEGKMYGRGLFVSINGFSPEVVRSLIVGKAIKTILIDGGDLTMVVEGLLTFAELIDRKVKAAQTKGLIYIDAVTGAAKV